MLYLKSRAPLGYRFKNDSFQIERLVSEKFSSSSNTETKMPKIWAVGGGKGGVGKSFITGNIGISLAQKGFKVVLIDADLGGANLHTCLGMPNPEKSLSDFVLREVENIDDIMINTPIPNLKLISGAQDTPDVANSKHAQKLRIIRSIQDLDVDYVLLDLGAGTTFHTIDFFLLADPKVIVVLPEPMSIENAYRFIKSSLYRKLRHNAPSSKIRAVVNQSIEKRKELGLETPHELVNYLRDYSTDVKNYIESEMVSFRPKLVLNQVRNRNDIKVGFAMVNATMQYFGVTMDFVGYVEYDEAVLQSVLQRQPLLTRLPLAVVTKRVKNVCENLLRGYQLQPKKK